MKTNPEGMLDALTSGPTASVGDVRDFMETMQERIGCVNVYQCQFGHVTHVILLARVVTPFMVSCPHVACKLCAQSTFYSLLPVPSQMRITHAWYRPSVEHFTKIDDDQQQWVLEGHGLLAPLDEAIQKALRPDEFDKYNRWSSAIDYLRGIYKSVTRFTKGEVR